ncbi:anti-sigma factor [Cupriavidus sp. KK10]|jgi:anti-sigma factor RsiW|uniref:anti-sigma factor family protein n=1 Tax=Cupriavidus sp. KK10 TaxID=1478019 RepID=UPI001BA890DE|nr:anti-sigma factor [Cupriavidus sp. KK10]QUN30452.1 anti-sigma factor [Cupriavidus sp. KK10]
MSENRPVQEEDLQAYVDNALDDTRRREIEAYMRHHPDVAGRIEGYIAQREQLRASLAPIVHEPIPPDLNLRHMLEARRTRSGGPWRMAASVLVALCIGGMGGWIGRGATEPAPGGIAALAREATASYQVFASDTTRPVELSAEDSAALVSWVSTRLRRPVSLPDLSKAGYHYMGGRLVATEHGPAGLFMYDDGHGTRLAMLVRPMQVERDMPMKAHEQAGVAGYSWANQGLGYSLVASASTSGLHPLADEMRRQIDQQAAKAAPA